MKKEIITIIFIIALLALQAYFFISSKKDKKEAVPVPVETSMPVEQVR